MVNKLADFFFFAEFGKAVDRSSGWVGKRKGSCFLPCKISSDLLPDACSVCRLVRAAVETEDGCGVSPNTSLLHSSPFLQTFTTHCTSLYLGLWGCQRYPQDSPSW